MSEIEKQAESLSAEERELLAERLLATVKNGPLAYGKGENVGNRAFL